MNRVVNTDYYYTSYQLLEMLRVFGLYGRGTTRESSKHFPRCVMISKSDDLPRGSIKQAVSQANKIVAASWVDGSIVNIVSNADTSTTTTVYRQVGREKRPFPALSCVIEYNQAMQRVDRIDQLRAPFSVADGHSFRKWHKKLTLSFVDLARCNAFITRKLAGGCKNKQDPHRVFMVELTGELLSGAWKNSLSDSGTMHTSPIEPDLDVLCTPTSSTRRMGTPLRTPTESRCIPRHAHVPFPDSRTKRRCVVCRFEGRYPTEATNYQLVHNALGITV
ncbi:hypothetical protein ON010_g5217 [Phytophthora cinnamomi]|nr:hypothetical protein ON010_g5217 [Phytophthora cinnamomi]